jgi:methyltransferase (TIGR00027 family)
VPELGLRDISDTARWVAMYRARETERPDALFRDPFARRLAGERGEQLLALLARAGEGQSWPFVTRTVVIDRFIEERVRQGADLVLNLAAGLDARPYRMALPPSLRWVEVDLPELLAYKEDVLRGEKPVCALERIALDLADVEARRTLFARLAREARSGLVVTEGLLIYLTPEQVGALAADLATAGGLRHWVFDISSPGLKKMIEKQIGAHLSQASAPLQFAPEAGPAFFAPYGWEAEEVRSMIKEARRLGRLSPLLWLLSFLPDPKGRLGSRPWSGLCLMRRR